MRTGGNVPWGTELPHSVPYGMAVPAPGQIVYGRSSGSRYGLRRSNAGGRSHVCGCSVYAAFAYVVVDIRSASRAALFGLIVVLNPAQTRARAWARAASWASRRLDGRAGAAVSWHSDGRGMGRSLLTVRDWQAPHRRSFDGRSVVRSVPRCSNTWCRAPIAMNWQVLRDRALSFRRFAGLGNRRSGVILPGSHQGRRALRP